MSRIALLGIPLDSVTCTEAVGHLRSFCIRDGQASLPGVFLGKHVATPNSEMLVEAVRNPVFFDVLHRTALNLPDSVGLLLMARWTGQILPERVTGVDTVERFCTELTEECSVFFLGGAEGTGERARARFQALNPRLRIAGTFSGSPRDKDAEEIICSINAARPVILLVAFGAPEQDLWIDRYLCRMPSVCLAIGVGGTLDYFAGVQWRAPFFLRRFGFEWLWRLLCEPRRLRRILNAVFVFPFLVLRYGRVRP